MANRAFLLTSVNEDLIDLDQGDTGVLGANYTIPLLWLTMFTPQDIQHYQEEEMEIPFLVGSVERAKECFAPRAELLRRFFTNIDADLAAWQHLLSMLTHPYVKAEIFEIVFMHDEGEQLLKDALAFFDTPTESAFQALLDITALSDYYDASAKAVIETEWRQNLILGWKDADWVPWSDPDDEIFNEEEGMPEKDTVQGVAPAATPKSWWQFWRN